MLEITVNTKKEAKWLRKVMKKAKQPSSGMEILINNRTDIFVPLPGKPKETTCIRTVEVVENGKIWVPPF